VNVILINVNANGLLSQLIILARKICVVSISVDRKNNQVSNTKTYVAVTLIKNIKKDSKPE
jgi:hypothetical protein